MEKPLKREIKNTNKIIWGCFDKIWRNKCFRVSAKEKHCSVLDLAMELHENSVVNTEPNATVLFYKIYPTFDLKP